MTSNHPSNLRLAKIPLSFGTGAIPALGFGTLIPDPAETKSVTTNALRVGFRHFVGTAVLTTAKTPDRARENYNISEISDGAVDDINRIQIRSRLNSVVETEVPGFIARGG